MAAAAKKKKSRPKARKGDKSFPIKLVGISLILIVFLKHSFIFLIVGMLPAIVARLVDTTPQRYLFRMVAATNFAGVAPFMAQLMADKNSSGAVQAVVSTPSVWLIVYSSAGLGWILYHSAPALVKASMVQFSDNKVSKIEQEQKKLIEEWGSEVKGE